MNHENRAGKSFLLSILSIFPFLTLPENMDLGILQLFGFYQKEFAPSKEHRSCVADLLLFALQPRIED